MVCVGVGMEQRLTCISYISLFLCFDFKINCLFFQNCNKLTFLCPDKTQFDYFNNSLFDNFCFCIPFFFQTMRLEIDSCLGAPIRVNEEVQKTNTKNWPLFLEKDGFSAILVWSIYSNVFFGILKLTANSPASPASISISSLSLKTVSFSNQPESNRPGITLKVRMRK